MPRFRQHADAVAARAGTPVVETGDVLRAHLDEITDTLARDERVIFPGFGTFRMIDNKPAFVPSEALLTALSRTSQ